MKTKIKTSLIFIVFLLHNRVVAQTESTENNLIWSDDYVIRWEDFRFRDSALSDNGAVSLTNIIVKGFWDNSLPNFTVVAVFDREGSWTLDTTSVDLLKHEILHFDITELHARKIRKGIDELRRKGEKNIEVYNNLITRLLNNLDETQILYDQETSHGVYKDIQEKWSKSINKEIQYFNEFAPASVSF